MPPRKPPPVPGLDDLPVESLHRVLLKFPGVLQVEHGGKYPHWDELRHREPPGSLTTLEWWGLIKFARLGQRRNLPLLDEKRNRFAFVMTDTVQRLVHEVDRDASGRIELPEDVTNQSTRDRYIVNSLIEEAFRSSQLEGASTTRHVAKEMIRTKREPRTDSERMILNNFYAMEWVREHKTDKLTITALLELHAIVTRGTLEHPGAAGRFRRADEDVNVVDNSTGEIVHHPPKASLLEDRIQKMCDFANAVSSDEPFIHPVVRSILVHFWLAYDHPFVDGNGRTARALFYWSMLRGGYWLTEFISISRVIKHARGQYDRAFVYSETDESDATYFLLNQLNVLKRAIDELFAYLKRKSQELRDVEKKLRGRDDLNHRQLAILSHLLHHPGSRFTIEAHQSSHRVVYQTARTDLLGLVEHGFLEQTKIGKRMYFSGVRDLAKRLKP
ncbi:MAG: Fic family protein [Kofleriaceae bacterium]